MALALVTAVVAIATGCGKDSSGTTLIPTPDTTTDAATPTRKLTPAERQAVREAKIAFDEFMEAYVRVSKADVPTGAQSERLFGELAGKAGSRIADELRPEIVGRWAELQTMEGTLTWSVVQVEDIHLRVMVRGTTYQVVFLRYCVDATDWVPVDSRTGEPAGPPGVRHQWRYTVSRYDDGGATGYTAWLPTEREPLEDQPC